MKTKILITGAKGQLAKTIHHLYANNNLNLEFVFTSKTELDITNKVQVSSFFDNHQFDYCINCAAYTNVEQSELEPDLALKVNAEAVKTLAEVCKNHDTILMHISTDYVFDGNSKKPYKEEDQTNPINEYGKSKLAGELAIKSVLNRYFIIRTSWLYSSFGKNFVKTIINKIETNSDLNITTSQIGSPTSCTELSKFIIFLITTKSNAFGVYHFSGQGETTWYEFALEIAIHFDRYNKLKISPANTFKRRAERPKYSVLNNHKVNQIFEKKQSWKQDVKQTVKEIIEQI